MKEKKLTLKEAEELYVSEPLVIKGKWKTLCEEVAKTSIPVQVSDITRGQAYALKRAAQEAKLRVRTLEKGKKVIILPAETAVKK